MRAAMQFQQPPLPYAFDDLAPSISEEALRIHYERHQRGYLDRLNKYTAVQQAPDTTTIEDIIFAVAQDGVQEDLYRLPQEKPFHNIFNCAAQVWNHTFFWNSMKPTEEGGGGEPTGPIKDGIRINYGTFEKFRETLRRRALSIFGSGWVWVGAKDEALWCLSSANAAMPLIYGISPILTIDMWEHAYYLDYQGDRGAYFDAVMDNLINWEFANSNLENAPF